MFLIRLEFIPPDYCRRHLPVTAYPAHAHKIHAGGVAETVLVPAHVGSGHRHEQIFAHETANGRIDGIYGNLHECGEKNILLVTSRNTASEPPPFPHVCRRKQLGILSLFGILSPLRYCYSFVLLVPNVTDDHPGFIRKVEVSPGA